tara:strand:+ start:35 stop:253 length:219 start_codon:yes stop_codon:yes gene_type:complete
MLQGLLIKKIVEIIMKQFKLDEIKKYVEEPNELDRQVKSLQKSVNKYGQYIEEMEKDIAEIKAITKKLKIFK